jgi:methylmalonyl-CoA/ethylmalonyl-CoA epimerase
MSSIAPIERRNNRDVLEKRLHHVGYLVTSIAEAVDDFADALSCGWDGKVVFDPLQKVRVTFLRPGSPDQPSIELVEPAGEDSPVRAFLKRGTGLHHICFEVSDLDKELEQTRNRGGLIARLPLPAAAFDGRRIAWVYTKSRMLIEFLER